MFTLQIVFVILATVVAILWGAHVVVVAIVVVAGVVITRGCFREQQQQKAIARESIKGQ